MKTIQAVNDATRLTLGRVSQVTRGAGGYYLDAVGLWYPGVTLF